MDVQNRMQQRLASNMLPNAAEPPQWIVRSRLLEIISRKHETALVEHASYSAGSSITGIRELEMFCGRLD